MQAGQQGGRFLVQLVLARLLTPEDFGLVAVAAGFIMIINIGAQGGMGAALIQIDEITENDRRTAFTLNVVLGLLGSATICLLAPSIAGFYRMAELEPVLQLMSLSVLFQQFGSTHGSLFNRELMYKDVMKANVPAVFIAGFVGIVLAWFGMGVWALAWQLVITALVTSLLLWCLSSWTPRFAFSLKSVKRLLPFGSRVAVNRLLNAIFENAYVLVIGKYYSASSAGYYQRARGFQLLPVVGLVQVFDRVAFPLLSRLQADQERSRHAFKKLLFLLSWCLVPGLGLLAAIAEPMVLVLIKEKWLPVVPLLRVFCAMGVFIPLSVVSMSYLQAIGRADLVLRLSIAGNLLMLLNIFFAAQINVMALVVGQFVAGILIASMRMLVLHKCCSIDFWSQLKVVLRPLLTACVVFCSVTWSFTLMPLDVEFRLLSGLLTGGLFWWLGLFVSRSDFQQDVRHLSDQYPILKPIALYSLMLVPVVK